MKELIRKITPPFLLDTYLELRRKPLWHGDFKTWDEVITLGTGYNENEILKRTTESIKRVLAGEALFERDSVLFKEMHWNFPLIASLQWIAFRNAEILNILDIGGSLASTYLQHRNILNTFKEYSWTILEQESYVSVGNNIFSDRNLNFTTTLDPLKNRHINAVLFSSSLQYFEEPYKFLSEVLSFNPQFVLFDRTSFNFHKKDRLTLQTVPEEIYSASYPCWFFDEDKFKKHFDGYQLIWEFESFDKADIPSKFKGFLFERL